MAKIKYLLAGLGVFITAGCVSVPYINPPRTDDTSLTFYIKVTSEPSDAEIYINDMLFGRTPIESLPLAVSCINRKDWVEDTITVKGQYILKIHKKGYKDIAEPLEFTYSWQGKFDNEFRPSLKKSKFDFKLEKED